MAVVYDPTKKEDKNIAPQFGQQTSAIQGNEAIQGPQAGAPQTPKGSGSFTNLQKLLGANVGAGTQMAQQVGQLGQQQAGQVSKLQEQARTPAQQTITGEKEAQSQAGEIGQAVAATKSTGDVNKLLGDYGAKLSQLTGGSQNLQQASDILASKGASAASALGGLQTTGQALGSERGRAGLLQQIYRQPSYTKGMSALDQALMQTEGRSALQQQQANIAQQTQQAQQQQEALAGLQKDISGLTSSKTNIAEALKKGLTGAGERADVALTEQAKADTKAAAKEKDDLISRITTGKDSSGKTVTSDDYKMLGIEPGSHLYGTNFTPDQLKRALGSTEFNKTDIIKQKDIDAFNVIKQLTGAAPQYNLPTEQKQAVTMSDAEKQQIAQQLAGSQRIFEQAAKEAGLIGQGSWTERYQSGIPGIMEKRGRRESISMGNINDVLKAYKDIYGKEITSDIKLNPQQVLDLINKSTEASRKLAPGADAEYLPGYSFTPGGSRMNAEIAAASEAFNKLQDFLKQQGYYKFSPGQ